MHAGGGRPLEPYVSFRVEIPQAEIADLPSEPLAPEWDSVPAPRSLAEFGTAWIARGSSVALRVRSAVVKGEFNYLLNPGHPNFGLLVVDAPLPYRFDPRILEAAP